MVFRYVDSDTWRTIGMRLLGDNPHSMSMKMQQKKFKSFFGTSWYVCETLWFKLHHPFDCIQEPGKKMNIFCGHYYLQKCMEKKVFMQNL